MSIIPEKIKEQSIDNMMIFVCDALRWDLTPRAIKAMGITCKTIASSLYTASSFPSIFSGLYPPKHGVFTWEDALSKDHYGLLDIADLNTSLRCENTWVDMGPEDSQIHRLCGRPDGISLDEIEEPFIYIEDDKGGHCPYGFTFDEYEGGGCFDFFKEYGNKDRNELVKAYKKGIKDSVENFKRRLSILKSRGIEKNTLVIFTSDHGELLGEYGGLVNHGRPPCPELTYVPTIFIHPSLGAKEVTDGVARHVDIYPSLMELLGLQMDKETDGISLFHQIPRYGYSFQRGGHKKEKSKLKSLFRYTANSIWDHNGGHVFHELGTVRSKTLFNVKIHLQKHPEFWYMRESVKDKDLRQKLQTYKKAMNSLTKRQIKYGKPAFNRKQAAKMIEEYQKNIEEDMSKEREHIEMDEEVEKRLKSLGYMD